MFWPPADGLTRIAALDPQPSTATVRYRTIRFYECALTLHAFCEFLSPACQSQSGSLIFRIILQHFERLADGVRLPLRADVRNFKRNLTVMRIACLPVHFLCVAPPCIKSLCDSVQSLKKRTIQSTGPQQILKSNGSLLH